MSVHENLGTGEGAATFRAKMKRLAYLISAAAIALSFNACEPHSAADLPAHYQHKGQAHHSAAAGGKAPADHGKLAH